MSMDIFAEIPVEIRELILSFLPLGYHPFMRVAKSWQHLSSNPVINDIINTPDLSRFYKPRLVLPAAIKYGRLDILKKHEKWIDRITIINEAIAHNQLEVVKWCRNVNIPIVGLPNTCDLEMIKYLMSQGMGYNRHIVKSAIDYRNVDIIKLLLESGYQIFASEIATTGNLEALKLVADTIDNRTAEVVVYSNVLKTIQWVHERISTLLYANKASDLEVIKWFHSIGARFDSITCALAAKHGRLDSLKWLWDRGIQPDFRAFLHASSEVLKWLAERLPLPETISSHNSLEALKWIVSVGRVHWQWEITAANSETCEFLAENAPMSYSLIEAVARFNLLPKLALRKSEFTPDYLERAITHHDTEIIRFLRKNNNFNPHCLAIIDS